MTFIYFILFLIPLIFISDHFHHPSYAKSSCYLRASKENTVKTSFFVTCHLICSQSLRPNHLKLWTPWLRRVSQGQGRAVLGLLPFQNKPNSYRKWFPWFSRWHTSFWVRTESRLWEAKRPISWSHTFPLFPIVHLFSFVVWYILLSLIGLTEKKKIKSKSTRRKQEGSGKPGRL